jgi:2-iminobutanoate/2-iminopropanoate deaminase
VSAPTKVFTADAPAPIGPYSQAIAHQGVVFCSGQIALDPQTGELDGDDVSTQARRVLDNLGAVLRQAGCGYADVVKTTVYLVDMSDFAAVNAVYQERFGASKPARSTVAVAGLPKGGRVEIDCVALLPSQ